MLENDVVLVIDVPQREDNGIFLDPVRDGKSPLDILVDRMERVVPASNIVLLTGKGPEFSRFNRFVAIRNLSLFPSMEEHRLKRVLASVAAARKNTIIRVNGANIFTDPELVEYMATYHINTNSHYTYCNNAPAWAVGEVMDANALQKAFDSVRLDGGIASDPGEFFLEHSGDYDVSIFSAPVKVASQRDYSLATDVSARLVREAMTRLPDPVGISVKSLP